METLFVCAAAEVTGLLEDATVGSEGRFVEFGWVLEIFKQRTFKGTMCIDSRFL